ncbi:hypothetical protein [Actinomadura oligospora]|uniref:hypothetical protein n=1 Tax=Actinomadura oligospora TaxID=111804 RepID=UPI000479E7E7|nr:hypothetical protein [Actinomadura oligospora]
MTTIPTVHIEAQGGATLASRRPVPQETEMNLLSQDLSRERIPAGVDAADAAELRAARVRAMRRAKRQAQFRAARVSRALLAPAPRRPLD